MEGVVLRQEGPQGGCREVWVNYGVCLDWYDRSDGGSGKI